MKTTENMLATLFGIMMLVFLLWIILGIAVTAKASGLNETLHTYVIYKDYAIVQGTDSYNALHNAQHGAYDCILSEKFVKLGFNCDIDPSEFTEENLTQIK
jgi:hypothetical protein